MPQGLHITRGDDIYLNDIRPLSYINSIRPVRIFPRAPEPVQHETSADIDFFETIDHEVM